MSIERKDRPSVPVQCTTTGKPIHQFPLTVYVLFQKYIFMLIVCLGSTNTRAARILTRARCSRLDLTPIENHVEAVLLHSPRGSLDDQSINQPTKRSTALFNRAKREDRFRTNRLLVAPTVRATLTPDGTTCSPYNFFASHVFRRSPREPPLFFAAKLEGFLHTICISRNGRSSSHRLFPSTTHNIHVET